MRFGGQVVMISGAAGAIGSATAAAFASEGAALALVDLVEIPAQVAATADDARVIRILADVGDALAVDTAVHRTLDAFGRIDVLVNVAGVVLSGSTLATSPEDWDRVLRINLTGTFLLCRAVAAPMREQGYGRIVNMGSLLGKNGGNARPWIDRSELERAGSGGYGVSKAGVHALTAYLAKELVADGITVNCVAPGPIASGMTSSFPQALRDLIPAGRMGAPEDVAAAVLFLADPSSGFVTGEILDVNGGMLCD